MKTKSAKMIPLVLLVVALTGCAAQSSTGTNTSYSSAQGSSKPSASPTQSPPSNLLLKSTEATSAPSVHTPTTTDGTQSDSTPSPYADRVFHTLPAIINISPTPTPTPSCPSAISGIVATTVGQNGDGNITGTTTADLQTFADEYNSLRVADCLTPIPFNHIVYSSCLEARVIWFADDPSLNPLNTWGHTGVVSLAPDDNGQYYTSVVPIRGCDGDLAGGTGYSGADVALAWWNSPDHRASLYQPAYTGSFSNICIYFGMEHGGVPNEPSSFVRAASYWANCS